MNNKKVFGILGIIAASALIATSVYAYQGDSSRKGPNHTAEREAKVTKTIENVDYEGWKNLMLPTAGVLKHVNKENFPTFAKMWKMEHSGDIKGAATLRAELGLGQGGGKHDGSGRGQGKGMGMHRNIAK